MNHILFRYMTILTVLILSLALGMSASAQQVSMSTEAIPESPNGIYIVQMKDEPVVAYKGGIKGLKATKPN